MNIFVTVGTTHFDRLIKSVASAPFFKIHTCILQTGPGGELPSGFECFSYTDDIERYYGWADVVITHSGAGSIYRLLALKKRVVIVPNMDRIDKHQMDIATYMHANEHALSVTSLDELVQTVEAAQTFGFTPYEHTEFFAAEEMLDFIESS